MQNNELVKAIKAYILEDEDKEEVIAELKRCTRDFESEPDYNGYQHGNILPLYDQIRTAVDELLEENE